MSKYDFPHFFLRLGLKFGILYFVLTPKPKYGPYFFMKLWLGMENDVTQSGFLALFHHQILTKFLKKLTKPAFFISSPCWKIKKEKIPSSVDI